MTDPQKIFFVSDFHLGADTQNESSLMRERKIIRWMNSIQKECKALYLLGDIFDFWFEHKEVIPKGHVRLLGKLAEFTDAGIPVHIFTGNHDMWMFDYFDKEIGLIIHRDPFEINIGEKNFFLAHGDGLGPGDHGYKFIKKVFRGKLNQWLFARLHPNLSIAIMKFFSQRKGALKKKYTPFMGAEKEWLIQFCETKLQSKNYDYLVFGHRHFPIDHILSNGSSRYVNLGDMIKHNTYAVFDGLELKLKAFENDAADIYRS